MIKKVIAVLILWTGSAVSGLSAQVINGKVIDDGKEPLAYANVVLLSLPDSTFITGTISSEEGTFQLQNSHPSPSIIKLSSVGYLTQFVETPKDGKVGTIAMQPDNVMLNEVVIRSTRPVTSIKGNGLVTGIENSVLAHAGTANDVLSQVPMVLGRDGNFEVFGKGRPLIYINGRQIQDLSELSQLSSSDIKSVEVISNPGAKYDASIKSVIRIRTKRPEGDGWSGTLRTQNGVNRYFISRNQANLKYRTGGLELFTNFGYLNGKHQDRKISDMVTHSTSLIDQQIESKGWMRNNEFYGKVGFAYQFNDNHHIGGYYNNGLSKQTENGSYESRISIDDVLTDQIKSEVRKKHNNYPKHSSNIYYNGVIGKLDIDFNLDYLWKKNRTAMMNDEVGTTASSIVHSQSTNHNRLFAQKLTLSYPLWKGGVEVGEEFTSSRFNNLYNTDAAQLKDATSRVDEKNIAGFVQIMQRIANFEFAAGLRYEHVDFSYLENGQAKTDQNKTYNNLFPSLSLSTEVKDVQLSLSYTHKTERPNYADLDGTIDYINLFTLESGNPFLKPVKIHTVELMGAWRQFFAQVAYTYKKDPIFHTIKPYDESGEVKLITKDNFPKINSLEAFVGSQFQVGIWQPKLNVGLLKQWFTIDYLSERKRVDNPMVLVQWQNAVHLPGDIWFNLDMQWMSEGNEENNYIHSTSYMNAKLYKSFFKNRFSITLEANDLFNKSNRNFTFYGKEVLFHQLNKMDNRSFMLTLQFQFNKSRDRYRGSGAGDAEKSRF